MRDDFDFDDAFRFAVRVAACGCLGLILLFFGAIILILRCL